MPKENEKRVVKWFLVEKNPPIIKFENDDTTYNVSSNVIEKSNFSKYPVKGGDTVEVGFKNGEVSFLKKQNNFAKKSTGSSSASKPAGTSATKTLTVEAVFKDESIKFAEESIDGKKWTKVSDELSAQGLKNIGVVAKNQVTITLTNGIITAIDLVASKKEETKAEAKQTDSYAKKSSYRDEDSTDKRTALMTAKDIVVALVNSDKLEKDAIKNAIDDLSKACYTTLQNL